jgi:hypothetical protein
MSAAARLYWPQQQQTCWHRTALDRNDTVLVDEDLNTFVTLERAHSISDDPDTLCVAIFKLELK